MNATGLCWWKVKIISGNDLVAITWPNVYPVVWLHIHSITRAWFLIQICKISFSSPEMLNVLSLYNMSQMLLLVAVQAPSHYLVQWLPNRMMPNGTIRQQWVNSLWPGDAMWPLATGSGNRKLPVWQQAIKWTNVALLTIGHWGNGFYEISLKMDTFLVKKMHLEMLSAKL